MSDHQPLWGLGSKAKQIVENVFNFFLREPGADKTAAILRTVQATGVGRTTVYKIRKEAETAGVFSSPQRPQKREPYKALDDFDETAVRNKVHEFYTVQRQLPTITNLHAALKEDISYPGSHSSLRHTLLKLGFKWKKTNDNRKVLIEKPSVVCQRLKFYKRKKELEDVGFTLVFIDETWIDTACCNKRCWQGPSTQGLVQPVSKGQRLIMVNAGCKDGFIPGAQLIYKASCNTGDYHREMNGANFMKWVQQQLLPNLDFPSAIVMDNASYHSTQMDKCPSSNTRKAEIMVCMSLTHLYRMEFPSIINWSSPFPFQGMMGGIFHFFPSNFDRKCSKQTVQTPIRPCILRRLIWVCVVCLCPTKWKLGLYGLISQRYGSKSKPKRQVTRRLHVFNV